MTSVLLCAAYENRIEEFADGMLDGVFTDMPYNVSELSATDQEIGFAHNRSAIQRYVGNWDRGFSPVHLIDAAARKIKPGGWFISSCSDRQITLLRDILSGDHTTTRSYLEWMASIGVLSKAVAEEAEERIPECSGAFDYKATITWRKTNPGTSVRKSTLIFATEYVVVARRKNYDGTPAKPVAFNWIGTVEMHNAFFETPRTSNAERLYWHANNPIYDGEDIVDAESIEVCPGYAKCSRCKSGDKPMRHLAQKPLEFWKYLYDRYTLPGMKVYDPFAGVGSGGVQARVSELEWVGTEILPIYAKVGQMWLGGAWSAAHSEEIEQGRMW